MHWILLALLTIATPALALNGTCVIQVDGKTYLNGPCPITLEKGGDFVAGSDGTKAAKYFAYVSINKETGKADGFWNGPDGASHAHDPLGELTRQGACWVNQRAKVCAMR